MQCWGWIGGTERIDGKPPTAEAIEDRHRLLRKAVAQLFGRRETINASWTYLTCRKQADLDPHPGMPLALAFLTGSTEG
jgi:hypothetical protein